MDLASSSSFKKKKRKEGASPVVCVFGKAHRSLAFATSFCVFDELINCFFLNTFCNELLLVLKNPHFR